jgi:hypothetical protein
MLGYCLLIPGSEVDHARLLPKNRRSPAKNAVDLRYIYIAIV